MITKLFFAATFQYSYYENMLGLSLCTILKHCYKEHMNLYYQATALSFFRIKTWITSLLDIYGLKMENMQGVVGICI